MSGQKGSALVTTFLMILLLAAMASGIVSLLMEEATLSVNRIELARAESIADAAERLAVRKMNELSGWENWSGVEDKDFAGGKLRVSVLELSPDEKELRCTGVFGRSAVVRDRAVRRGPLAAEDDVGVYISDNALLISEPGFALVATRFDNPSSTGQGGGQGDWVYIRVIGVELQPDGTNTISLERLDGSTSSPHPWKEEEEAFQYDAGNDWLEAAFRLPEENNNGKEWKNCFVNLNVEIEGTRGFSLDYVPDSREHNKNDNVVCNIKNNTGLTVVLTAMTASWDQPEAYYERIRIRVLNGGPNYQAVWNYVRERAGSGEKVVFNQGKTVSIVDAATFRLEIRGFQSERTGRAAKRDMDNTSFRISFSAREAEYPETIVAVSGAPVATSSFEFWQAISIGMPQPVVRVYDSPADRENEGEGLTRWDLSQGHTYYVRVWSDGLSGPLRQSEGKLRLLDLFGEEEYSHADAFSEVNDGRYDAEISIPTAEEEPPGNWAAAPVRGWDYVLRIEMEDLQGRRFRYSGGVRIVQ